MKAAAEFKDMETGAHISRMSLYAQKLAQAMGMPVDFVETITFCLSSLFWLRLRRTRSFPVNVWEMLNECAEEAYWFLPVQVWSGQRLATSPVPNLTWRGVAATKIEYLNSKTRKVLNPNIEIRNKF